MSNKKIGLISLTALVLSSMIGSGIFSLPQNMAAVAGAEAITIGWLITGVGIIFLGLSFSLFPACVGFRRWHLHLRTGGFWRADGLYVSVGLLALCHHWDCRIPHRCF